MNNKLYVGNLSFETVKNDLQDLFARAGTVTDAILMQDRETGQSRGFGFVTMSSPQEAQEAINLFGGKEFQGRNLTVNEAKPREDRTGTDFRPSGGNGGARREFQRR